MPKETTSKTVKKSVKTPTVKKAAPPVAATKKVPAKKVAAKKTAAKTAAKTTTSRKVADKKPVTTVIAKLDVGFGNEIYIRGGEAGLSWDSGTLMSNTGTDEWIWKSPSVDRELEFKVLLNDTLWSTGANSVVFPGATVVFEPVF